MNLYRYIFRAALVLTGLVAGCASRPANVPDRVLMQGTRLFPESITSLRDGTLIIGTIGEGDIFRAQPGEARAAPWIQPGTNGLLSIFGVLADERTHLLWVCSNEAPYSPIKAPPGQPTSAVLVFDLRTGAPRGKFAFPQDRSSSLCNDIATSADGVVYVTDTRNARIFRLRPGAAALDLWLQSEALQGGVDGITFNDPKTMYVNTIEAGHLIRIAMNPDGSPGEVTTLQTSRPLQHPDGMRRVEANKLLLVEGSAGTADLVTITGDRAEIETLADGFVTPSGITAVGSNAWVIEGKFAFRYPKMQGQDPGPFNVTRVPWRSKAKIQP